MIKSQDGSIWEIHGLEPAYSKIGIFIYGYMRDRKLVRLGKYESKKQADTVLDRLEKWYSDLEYILNENSDSGEVELFAPRIFRMPQAEELGV